MSAATTLRASDRLTLRVSGGWRESDDFDTPVGPANRGVRQGDERKSLRFDLHYQANSFLEVELEGTSTQLQQAGNSAHLARGRGVPQEHAAHDTDRGWRSQLRCRRPQQHVGVAADGRTDHDPGRA